jgi:hypothetical protein
MKMLTEYLRDIRYMETKLKLLPLFENESNMDIIITIPSTIKWEDYLNEINSVSDYKQVMNFKVSQFPQKTKIGNRCYLCHKGNVIGWMEIVGMEEKEFQCTTTGKKWKGKFIQRSGPFHYIEKQIPMKGFQGFRYY